MSNYSAPEMLALPYATLKLFASLPKEFTTKEFQKVYESQKKPYSLCLNTYRKYGIVVTVRTEPTTYTTTETIYTNPITKQEYTLEALLQAWSDEIAQQFGVSIREFWRYRYRFGEEREVKKEGYRNIYAVCEEKLKAFLNHYVPHH